jgi:hypothetical protein
VLLFILTIRHVGNEDFVESEEETQEYYDQEDANAIHWLDVPLEAQEDVAEYELEMNRAYAEARAE